MHKKFSFIVNLTLALILLVFAILLMRPFFTAILWASIFAIMFYSSNTKVLNIVKNKNLAAASTTMLVVLCVVIPVFLIASNVYNELSVIVHSLNHDFDKNIALITDNSPTFIKDFFAQNNITDIESIKKQISLLISSAKDMLTKSFVEISQGALHFVFNIAIFVYLLFFMLRDAHIIINRLKTLVPLDDAHKNKIILKINTVIVSSIKTSFIIALVQGVLGGGILFILGVKGFVFAGTLISLLALLPLLGPIVVWLPIAVYMYLMGDVTSAIILSIFGFFVLGLVDNIMRPILVGKDTNLKDYVVLISTLGGLIVFGPNGIILGPLIAVLFVTIVDEVLLELDKSKKSKNGS